jgi:cation transport ATPase
LDESAELSTVTDDQQRRAGHEQLLEKVLRFRLEGEFVQACWRPTLQAHHALAQQTCEVPEGLRTIQQAMTEFNHVATQRAAQQQRQAAERAAHQRHEETERTERTMQVLEVFIVTFYSVELAHILGESFDFGHTVFVGWSLIGVALATFFMAALLISWKWLKTKGTKWTVISLFALATTIHALFLTANAWWKAADTTTRPVVPHSSNVQQPTDEPDGHSQANPEKHK